MKKHTKIQTTCFCWSGVKYGNIIHGINIALTQESLVTKLYKQHIIIVKIDHCHQVFPLSQHAKPKQSQLIQLIQQLSTMINADIPLLTALDMLANQKQVIPIQKILLSIEQNIQNGSTLSMAMRRSHPYFDSRYSDIIEVGEVSGNLSSCLLRLASLLERQQHIKAKLIKAAIYPIFVFFTSIVVTYLMLVFVIPEFSKIYSSMNAQLPTITRWLIAFSSIINHNGIFISLVCIFFFFLSRMLFSRSKRLRSNIQNILLTTPIIGSIMIKAEMAQSMQTLSTCYSSGIPIMTCLHMAETSVNTIKYELAFRQIAITMASGQSLNYSLSREQCFPAIVEQMITIGENSGTLDRVFEKLANDYSTQVNDIVDNLGKIIEPIIILFIGTLVGGIIIAMYLPIFNLMSVLG